MNTNRGIFLETFARATPELKTVFINHSGPPSKLLTDLSAIELLADKKARNNFIEFACTHPLVKELQVIKHFQCHEIWVSFKDGSKLRFKLLENLVRRVFSCLPLKELRNESFVNEHRMLVASHHHHYEYLILEHQFAQIAVPERYKIYFGSFTVEQRTAIFRYIQPKYDLIINTLDDMFEPSSSFLLKIMVGLRYQKPNRLLVMTGRLIHILLFKFGKLFSKMQRVIHPAPGNRNLTEPMTVSGSKEAVV